MINNSDLKRNDLREIILGIRKKLNLSQTKLHKKLGVSRQSISRFEAKQRTPNGESINKILNFVKENNLDIKETIDENGKNLFKSIKLGDRLYTPQEYLEKALSTRIVYTADDTKAKTVETNRQKIKIPEPDHLK